MFIKLTGISIMCSVRYREKKMITLNTWVSESGLYALSNKIETHLTFDKESRSPIKMNK